jgi:hypothetical protein
MTSLRSLAKRVHVRQGPTRTSLPKVMRIRGLVLCIVVTGAVLCVAAAPVLAAKYIQHGELQGYPFVAPYGIGVNQTTGDIYVVDHGAVPAAVEQFNAEGLWQSSTVMPAGSSEIILGLAVDNACYEHDPVLTGSACASFDPSDGDVYVADDANGVVYKFDPNSKGELTPDTVTPMIPKTGAVNQLHGVAVDASGNVYLASAESETGFVSKFSSTGEPINENLITGLIFPYALAVDASGNIYVSGGSGTIEYSPTGSCVSSCLQINTDVDAGVALDSTDDVLVSDAVSRAVDEYTPAGEMIENPELDVEGTFESPRGIAVNNTSHLLYVVEEGALPVKIFELVKAKPPLVNTEPTTRVNNGPAEGLPAEELHGTIDPNGTEDAAEGYFEYGTEPCRVSEGTCGTKVAEPSQTQITGEAVVPISVRLDDLAPYTTYHDWAVGVNQENGAVHGEEQTFTTGGPIAPPEESPLGETKAPAGVDPGSLTAYPNLTGIAPVPGPKEVTKPAGKSLTRTQKLAKALRICRKTHAHSKRARTSCERAARKRFKK